MPETFAERRRRLARPERLEVDSGTDDVEMVRIDAELVGLEPAGRAADHDPRGLRDHSLEPMPRCVVSPDGEPDPGELRGLELENVGEPALLAHVLREQALGRSARRDHDARSFGPADPGETSSPEGEAEFAGSEESRRPAVHPRRKLAVGLSRAGRARCTDGGPIPGQIPNQIAKKARPPPDLRGEALRDEENPERLTG
jgi:hypothetical protein